MNGTTAGRGAPESVARCGWCRTRRVPGATVCPACGRDPSGPPPPAALVIVRSAAARAHGWWHASVAFVASLEPEYGKVESRRRPADATTPPARGWWQAVVAFLAALEPEYGKVESRRRPAGRAAPGRAAARPTPAAAARPTSPAPVPPMPIRSIDLMAPWRRVEQEERARAARENTARRIQMLRDLSTGGRDARRTRAVITPAAKADLERRMAEQRRAASRSEVDARRVYRAANVERT